MSKRKRWSYTAGSRGAQVTVYERGSGGLIYASAWDPSLREGRGGQRRISLGHNDRDAAKRYAIEQAGKLLDGQAEIRSGRVTLARLLALYAEHSRTKDSEEKSAAEKEANARQAECFVRVFGGDKDPHRITEADWQRFIKDRRSGEVDARGRTLEQRLAAWKRLPEDERMKKPEPKARPARKRTVEYDLRHLLAVLNWGTRWKDREGRYLLRENVCRGYAIPKEQNPRRPLMTQDRYEALLKVANGVTFEVVGRGERELRRAYLRELLVLANETGRRLSAILGLTYEDLNLATEPNAPHGSITWRAELDKKGIEWPEVAITREARAALEAILRDRPGIGVAPLFPSPKDRAKPMDRNLADRWLRKAERLAGLPPQEGSLWHAFRRKAATELKHAPDKDVMELMGWRDLRSLKTAYQHADRASMLVALESRRELREAR